MRKIRDNFVNGTITLSPYVQMTPYEDLNKIHAYLNSQHTSGKEDALGREKPFYNITVAKKNITARATDLDRKNIRFKASKAKDEISSFLLNIHLQKWMRTSIFPIFLNQWGDTLSGYNSAVVKVIENSEGLNLKVMDWNKIVVDFIDFESNPKVEKLELTEAQLRQNENYNQEVVDELCSVLSSRKTISGQQKDNKDDYVELYEIHGNLPLSYLTDREKDKYDYVQQMHVVSFIASKKTGKYDDYTLYSGKEKKDPYRLTWLLPSTDGSISLNGSVKNLFEAQWMKNHSVKMIKDQLDLASKILTQTADSSFATKNIISAMETGDILIHADGKPLTVVPNNSHDITSLQNFALDWEKVAQDLSHTPDILSGDNLPSGTPYRLGAIQQQEAHSNFDMMLENKGLHLEMLFKESITPYLLKKMNSVEEIATELDSYGIDRIDKRYISSEAIKRFNKKAVGAVLGGSQFPNLNEEQQQVQQELYSSSQRYIKPSDIKDKTWKEVIGKFAGDVTYEITNENQDKRAVLETLSSLLQTSINNPELYKLVSNKILQETGVVSPLEIKEASIPAQQQGSVAAGQAVGVG